MGIVRFEMKKEIVKFVSQITKAGWGVIHVFRISHRFCQTCIFSQFDKMLYEIEVYNSTNE